MPEEDTRLDVLLISQLDNTLPITSKQISVETRRDAVLSQVLEYTLKGWPNSNMKGSELAPFHSRRNELTVNLGCVMWGYRVIVPP